MFAEDLQVTFPLLSDPDLATIRAYGIEQPDKEIARPSTFVIDRDGTVIYAYVGRAAADRPPIDDMLAALP